MLRCEFLTSKTVTNLHQAERLSKRLLLLQWLRVVWRKGVGASPPIIHPSNWTGFVCMYCEMSSFECYKSILFYLLCNCLLLFKGKRKRGQEQCSASYKPSTPTITITSCLLLSPSSGSCAVPHVPPPPRPFIHLILLATTSPETLQQNWLLLFLIILEIWPFILFIAATQWLMRIQWMAAGGLSRQEQQREEYTAPSPTEPRPLSSLIMLFQLANPTSCAAISFKEWKNWPKGSLGNTSHQQNIAASCGFHVNNEGPCWA